MDELLFAPLRTIADRVRTRKVSSVELTRASLTLLERHGERLGAVVNILREQALREAAAADQEIRGGRYRGLLHGIPYGAKDLLATRGVPTTWGAAPYRKQVFDYDATAIRKLREAGAILVAKLAMVELAGAFGYDSADASFTGPARNPWNEDYWAGGSSSGPGAAVGAGLVPYAIGSETSGSIITPAAYSGVAGLRPTYGRVSRHGAMALSWTLDKLGPMCRTADDCGLVLAALAGRDPLDPTSSGRTFRWPPEREKRKFRVGILRGAVADIMPAVRDNFRASLEVIRRFADVVDDVPFPDLDYGPVVGTIINAEGASALRDLIQSGRIRELRSTRMHTSAFAAAVIPAVDYLDAMRVRRKIRKTLDELYAKYDALLAPARSTVATPLARNHYPGFASGPPVIPAGNLAGQPALSLLNGFGPNGLPTGIQFTGKAWSEATLLALGRAYQEATDWHTRRPRLPAK